MDQCFFLAQPSTQTPQSAFSPISTRNLTIDGYTLIKKLVLSGQATLYIAKKHNQTFVLKVYQENQKNGKNKAIYDNEARMFERISWKGIVPVSQCVSRSEFTNQQSEETHCSYLSMPYLQKGDLFQWIANKRIFSERVAKYLAIRLIQTLRYLQKKNIYHRDIKPQNILIGDNYEPLLLDFGLAMDSRQRVTTFVGSSRYAAPEVIKQKEYTSKSEIYSLGVVLFFMLTGHPPYNIAKLAQTGYRLLFQRKQKQFWQFMQKKTSIVLSESCKAFLLAILEHNPSLRPSLDDLAQFAWLKEDCCSEQEYRQYMQCCEVNESLTN